MKRTGAFMIMAAACLTSLAVQGTVQAGAAPRTAAPQGFATPAIPMEGEGYVALTPARLLDTRATGLTVDGQFQAGGALGAAGVIELTVLDRGGVPASGVAAVVLQLTSTGATQRSWISVFAHGTPGPATSNLNPVPGQVRSNLVIAPVGDDGKVDLWNADGSVQVIADVQGWVPSEATFTPVTPARLLDTRTSGPKLAANATRVVPVAGIGDVPEDGVGAVAVNLTAVNGSIRTWLTAYPTGTARPSTSNLNVNGPAPEANLVIVPLGEDGSITLHNALGNVDAIVDVLGWFPAGRTFTPIDGERVIDTRPGDPVPAGGTVTVDADAVPGVPAFGVGALVFNLTALNSTAPTWLTAYPAGAPLPVGSNANPRTTAVTANLVIAKLNADGEVTIRNANGSVDILVDVVGWFPSDVSSAIDEATITEDDGPTMIDVLDNDSDADGRPLGIEGVNQPAHGTVVIAVDRQTLTYEPDADYCNVPPGGAAADSFPYWAYGGPVSQVSVFVTCVDDAPVAVADTATVAEDGQVTVTVRGNDTDVDGGTMELTAVTQGANGSVVIDGTSGDPIYTPNSEFCNTPPGTTLDTFTYTLNGGSTATVTVTVNCVDDPPVAVNDDVTIPEDNGPEVLTARVNDTDIDGGPKVVASVGAAAHGDTWILDGDPGYTPVANYCGPDEFDYTLNGGSTATISITVTCIDDASHAVADTATMDEDAGATTISVRGNDTDIDGPVEPVGLATDPAHGTTALTNAGADLTYAPDANYCGSDTFSYTLAGGSTATVTVTVTCLDDAPLAIDDAATVAEDAAATAVDVLANDTDVDGGPISISSVVQPTSGTVVITGGGTGLTYQPNENVCGADSFTYNLSPGGNTATVTVTVTCVDDVPVPTADEATVDEDSSATTIDVLANDADFDGGPKLVVSVGDPAGGTAAVTNGGDDISYTPDADFCGDDVFNYEVTGGTFAQVTVHVTCIDDASVAVNDNAGVDEDSGTTALDVRSNDTDIDSVVEFIASVTTPLHGSAAVEIGNMEVNYQPADDYCGADSFTYTLTGGSTATVSVTVTCVDDAPIANADGLTVDEDAAAAGVDVLDNDSDIDAGPIAVDSVSDPAHGTTALDEGVVTYQPDADYCGPDSFTYTLTPGGSTTTVNVTVTCIDDAPIAVDDDAEVDEDAVDATVFVLANDTDIDGGPKLVTSVSGVTGGTASVAPGGGTVLVTPTADLCGLDAMTLTYEITGGSTATGTVDVNCIDDAPVAVDDSATVNEDASASVIDVLDNDTDVDAGPIEIDGFTDPLHGSVGPGVGGTLTYTPDGDYCGADSFDYTILPGGSTATVTITVTCIDDLSVAEPDTASVDQDAAATAIDVLGNDTDVEDDPRIILSVTQPTHGEVVITGPGAGLTYQPDLGYCNTLAGPTTDDFTYTLVGGSSTTVAMTVVCPDDPPTAVDDDATLTEDDPSGVISVLLNDTDTDGGPMTVDSVTQPSAGTVNIEPGGTAVRYSPPADYCNQPGTPTTFTYTLAPGSSTANVVVNVNCVDDNPVAQDNSAPVTEDSGVNFLNVLANDLDVDAGPISISSVTQPGHGTAAITGGGTGVSYEPDPNYCNSVSGPDDTFTYTLSPGGSTATVGVTVTCVDDNPIAVADSATVTEDDAATAVDVLANDNDVDGGPMSITSVTQPANGTVVITGGGTGLTYVPAANFCGSNSFTYTLTPGGSAASVSVTVTCVDDAPTAVADAATVVEDSPATAVPVLTNDTDVDAGPKSIQSVTQPANGTVVITGGGTGLTYTPHADYCNNPPGSTLDTFTYTLTPGGSTATVSVTVTCVDDPPVAIAHSYSGVANMRIDIPAGSGLLSGTYDVDGPAPLSVGTVSGTTPAGGVVSHNATTGAFSFTPPPGTTGNVTFTYTVCDATAPTAVCSAAATVTVNVNSNAMVWFVDDSASAGGANGTLDHPFTSLSALQADAKFIASTNRRIFVFGGSYNTGFTMPSDVRLYGQEHSAGSSFDDTMGITVVTGLQTRPTFNIGNTVTVAGQLTLGTNAYVRGLHLAPTSGTALVGSSVSGVDVRSVSIDAVNASGMDMNGVAGLFDLDNVSASGTGTGIKLVNSSASVLVRDGDITSTTDGVVIDGSTSSVQFFSTFTLGPITSGRTLAVQNRGSGGTVSFSGPISATGGTGISFTSNNAASSVSLLGKITLSTGASAAFSGSNGGVVQTAATNVQNAITTTSGVAINLSNTTIGGNGLIFQSINVSAAASSGIVLNNTGSTAGLSVVGTGAAGSGGTISGGTVGISLTSTRSPSFTRMVIQNTSGSGIQGTGVTNFSLTNSTISNSGTGLGADTSSVAFNSSSSGTENNLSGTVTITGNTFSTPYYHGVDIKNFAGTLTTVTISTNTITSATTVAASQGTGIRLQALGSASTGSAITAASITNNTVQNFPFGGGIILQGGNAGGGPTVTMGSLGSPLAITGNTVAGLSPAVPMNTNAISAVVAGKGTGFFTVSNNGTVSTPLTNVTGHVMLLAVNGDQAEGTFTVNNNVINGGNLGFSSNGISGATGPGSDGATATPIMTITATGNNVTNTNGSAIMLVARAAAGTLRATVQNNTAQVAGAGAGSGIRIEAGNGSSTGDKVCLTIANNTASGSGGSTGIGLRLHPTGSPPNLFQITGLSPSPASAAQTVTYVDGQNATGGGTAIINSPAGTPFSACAS